VRGDNLNRARGQHTCMYVGFENEGENCEINSKWGSRAKIYCDLNLVASSSIFEESDIAYNSLWFISDFSKKVVLYFIKHQKFVLQ